MEIQTRLFEQIKAKLPADKHLGKVLSEVLDMSSDSAYRRVRGETSLTPEEIKLLCQTFQISFDKVIGAEGTSVNFQYNSVQRSEFTFNAYLKGVNMAFERMYAQQFKRLWMSTLDLIFMELLNFPALTRFKLLYFAKMYLKIPSTDNIIFTKDWKGDFSDDLIKSTLNMYVKTPTVEVLSYESGKGLIREIVTFYEKGYIATKEDAIFLLDEVKKLLGHMREQSNLSKKFVYGQPVVTEENNYQLYIHETYIQDNTFIAETSAYRMLYITHNMINYLYTHDMDYVNKSFAIFKSVVKTCKPINKDNPAQQNAYFKNIETFLEKAKLRIEGLDLL